MNRREFIGTVTLSLLAAPLTADAQQAGKVYRIGLLISGSESASRTRVEAFRQGLRELGYAEGQNVVIEHRYAAEKYSRLPALAKALGLTIPQSVLIRADEVIQ